MIPLVTIPVSLVGACMFMYAFGFSVNTLTLLAMVLAIGLVVDDAIVVLENIYRNLENGMSRLDAALVGAQEIAFAVIAMTLTLAAVYAPLAFATGRTGRLFIEFALALAGAVLVSGFVALTLSPMMCSKLLRHETKHSARLQRDRALLPPPDRRLPARARLRAAPPHLIVARAPLVVAGRERRPLQEPALGARAHRGPRRDLQLRERAQEGSTVRYTARQPEAASRRSTGRSRRCSASTRMAGFPTVADGLAILRAEALGGAHAQAAGRSRRSSRPKLAADPGRARLPDQPALAGPVAAQPAGGVRDHELGALRGAAALVERFIAEASKNPGLMNLDTDLRLDKPELKVSVNRDKIVDVGASVEAVGRTLETMLGGRQVTRFKRDGEQYDVIVQVADGDRRTPGDISDIYVRGKNNEMIQLSNLVDGARERGAQEPEPLQPHPRRDDHRHARAGLHAGPGARAHAGRRRGRCCRPRRRPT